jgi:hypothetical protein
MWTALDNAAGNIGSSLPRLFPTLFYHFLCGVDGIG